MAEVIPQMRRITWLAQSTRFLLPIVIETVPDSAPQLTVSVTLRATYSGSDPTYNRRMLQQIRKHRERKKEIAELGTYIAGVYASELNGAKTPQERGVADQIAYSITQWEQNRITLLMQEEILNKLGTVPFDVPDEYWADAGRGYQRVLTHKGEVWARHELKKLRKADIEFWAKLVLPVVALVISIIALVKESH